MRLKKRVEELEKKAEWLKCFADEIYDGNEYLLYHLNNLLGRNPASADPLPYVLSTEALVELLKQQKRTLINFHIVLFYTNINIKKYLHLQFYY